MTTEIANQGQDDFEALFKFENFQNDLSAEEVAKALSQARMEPIDEREFPQDVLPEQLFSTPLYEHERAEMLELRKRLKISNREFFEAVAVYLSIKRGVELEKFLLKLAEMHNKQGNSAVAFYLRLGEQYQLKESGIFKPTGKRIPTGVVYSPVHKALVRWSPDKCVRERMKFRDELRWDKSFSPPKKRGIIESEARKVVRNLKASLTKMLKKLPQDLGWLEFCDSLNPPMRVFVEHSADAKELFYAFRNGKKS